MNSATMFPYGSTTSHPGGSAQPARRRHGAARSLLLSALCLAGITFLTGCEARYIAPYIYYKAALDDDLIDEIGVVIQDVTERFGLRTREFDHSMSEKHEGVRRLTTYVYYHEGALLRHDAAAMLAAGPTHVTMMFFGLERSPMPLEELDLFVYTLKKELEGRVGIDFCRADPSPPGGCPVEFARLDEAWEAGVRRRIQAGASPGSREDGGLRGARSVGIQRP